MNPSKDDIPTRRANLSPAKSALLEKRLRGNAQTTTAIAPRSTAAPLPLSFAQQRLWFLHQMQPDNPAYIEHGAIQLSGTLNSAALRRSLNELIQRHEALRTTFEMQDGQPVQVVAGSLSLDLPLVRLVEPSNAEPAIAIQRFAAELCQQPFDLTQAPLLRARLLQLSADRLVLLLAIHHIVFDGWSLGILFRELAALYAAFSAGQASPLPEPAVQYADFALWQRQWLQGDVLKPQLAYWQQQLKEPLPVLQLPTDYPRPAVQSWRGGKQFFTLSATLTAALKALSLQENATLFMALLAAFKVLLYRYTGADDIVVGSPIANRHQASNIGELVGLVANILALRTNLAGDLSFRTALSRVKQVALAAYAHQDLPFEYLVKTLQPQRDLSQTPLFQVVFGLRNEVKLALDLPGLTLSFLESHNGTAKFDLTLFFEETDAGLTGTLEYNTDLFEPATIDRMIGHLQQLLTEIVADPDRSIHHLPLLTDHEQDQLRQWNATDIHYPLDTCVHHRFETQVERTPDALAIADRITQLTYQQLNQRANQLAHFLQKQGIAPETPVGICVERSPHLIIGLLAILKAGAAYVPLDPAHPQARLEVMLSDAQVPVLLTEERLSDRFIHLSTLVVRLDGDWEAIAQEPDTNPAAAADAETLAYIIYTSGSTGTPKGVMIPHRGLSNLVYWHQSAFAVGSADRATQLAGPAFDASLWEVFPYLTAGASVHFVPSSLLSQPAVLRDWLLAQRITLTFVPTPLAEALLALDWPNTAPLRIMLTGGDQLHSYPSSPLPFALINNYGPTENTVVATSGIVFQPRSSRPPSIGRPIANVQTHILDRHLQPVPIGIPGELHISGTSLARGYLNRPDLTAAKFIASPCSTSLLYKTGDLARWLADGTIEFLGRIDNQVKLRGFRIELGEIEATLVMHPMVREAIVLTRDEPPGKRLVACVVVHSSQADTPADTVSELRNFLQEKLPSYMLPAAIVILEAMPLTANGKIDRVSVAEQYCASVAKQYHPAAKLTELPNQADIIPQTEAQRQIMAIWQEVLHLEKVGINDNFFNLGGHSLLLVQVQAKLRDRFNQEIAIVDLFRYPTVKRLAQQLSQSMGQSMGQSVGQSVNASASEKAGQDRANSRSDRQTTRLHLRELRQNSRTKKP